MHKRIHLLLLALLLATLPALAYDFEANGIYYNIQRDKATVAVTSSFSDCYTGDIVIPSSVQYDGETYSVTSIGYSTFSDCSGLTSVTIPNSVTSIGDRAFSFCSSLTSVTIPNSVTSIGDMAFSFCSSLTSVTIPNSVTSIKYGAFSFCSSLTSVTIPNSVTSIGDEAFSFCSSLTSVTIPNSVTSIEYSTFEGCRGLTSVTIPNSVTSIEYGAFSACSGLTSVTIPNSVTSIGDWAFSACSGLTSVTIPNSVTSIGEGAFYYCSGLTSVTIPNSVTSIEYMAFEGCRGLSEIYCAAEVPPTCNVYAFVNTANCTLYVPAVAVEAYRKAQPWNAFTNIVAFDFSEVEMPTWQEAVTLEAESTQMLFVPYVWASSDEAVATVSQSGEVTAVATGTCTITLTCEEKIFVCEVTVTQKPTGVAEVTSVSPTVVYDLQGRRVAQPSKGIFIVNGKKTLLK